MNNTINPDPNKTYKLFLVEVDDDDRERVLAARVRVAQVKVEPEYHSIYSHYSNAPIREFVSHENATITLDIIPGPDGTYLTIENFNEEEENESIQESIY